MRKNIEGHSSKNDEFNDLGFPRKIAYRDTHTSEPGEWKKELNEEIQEFLEQNPELKKLPMRADCYAIQRRLVRGREKVFAVLTYLGNGPAGSTATGWSAGSVPSENGHITTLNDLPSERSGDDYKNASNLDSFPAND